ncbi:hypothetical protein ACQGSX_22885 [Bacillus sp. GMs2/1]|uniref:hypothetical protein n=1 Tax=Bacillus sp. GMs2/1 TaxID=3418493 RepID=UPI003CEB4E67
MILGLVTGCSSKYDTGIPVTRNVAEKDQQKGSETKQNKREEFTGKLQYPELVEQARKPVPGRVRNKMKIESSKLRF